MNRKVIYLSFLIAPFTSYTIEEAFYSKKNSATITFATKINSSYITGNQEIFFTCKDSTRPEYAAAILYPSAGIHIPLAPKLINLNYKAKSKNPLHGAAICQLSMSLGRPLLASKELPYLYFFDSFRIDDFKLIQSDCIHDAEGKPTSGIIGFTHGITGNCFKLTDENKKDVPEGFAYTPLQYIIAAVKGASSPFGQQGSGLALLKPYNNETREEKYNEETDDTISVPVNNFSISAFDATTASIYQPWKKESEPVETDINKALPIDPSSPVFSIEGGLESILPDHVAFAWNQEFERFYIGISVKTRDDATEQQGACALAIGSVKDNCIRLNPICPHQIIDDHSIVGVRGAGKEAHVHQLATMKTSTGLSYLIMVGGQGTYQQTKQSVYAIPLVDLVDTEAKDRSSNARILLLDDSNLGRIADSALTHRHKNSIAAPKRKDVIKRSNHTLIDTTDAYRVGGTVISTGTITKIEVINDSVYAIVKDNRANGIHSVISSQPIFDQEGDIVCWTDWKTVVTSQDPIIDYKFNPTTGTALYFSEQQAKHTASFRSLSWFCHPETAVRSRASKQPTEEAPKKPAPALHPPITTKSLLSLSKKMFPQEYSGIQGVFDFDNQTEGVSGTQQSSLLVLTGYKKIALVQTGSNNEGYFKPTISDFEKESFVTTNGWLENFTPQTYKMLICSGGVLDDLGAITATTIVTDEQQAWLAVAGTHGTAILARPDGSGWSKKNGIGYCFSALDASMSFRKICTQPFVKQLRAYRGNLYITTHKTLDIINVKNLGTPIYSSSLDERLKQYRYTDCLVMDKMILLGTTKGLLCGKIEQDTLVWKPLEHPIGQQSVISMKLLTQSPEHSDVKKGAQLYVLCGSYDNESSALYRFYIDQNDADCTPKALQDYQYSKKAFGLMTSSSYQSMFSAHGSFNLFARSGTAQFPSYVSIAPQTFQRGSTSGGTGQPLSIPLAKDARITGMVQNSATGAWIIAGDFGLIIQEIATNEDPS